MLPAVLVVVVFSLSVGRPSSSSSQLILPFRGTRCAFTADRLMRLVVFIVYKRAMTRKTSPAARNHYRLLGGWWWHVERRCINVGSDIVVGLHRRVTDREERVEADEQVRVPFEQLVDLRHKARDVQPLLLECVHDR